MKKLSLILFLPAFFLACNSNPDANKTKVTTKTEKPVKIEKALLNPAEFKAKLQSLGNAQLLDVRTPEEYSEGHLENALNYDFYEDDFEAKLESLNPKLPVMLYCKSGGRSGKTFRKLKEMGFKSVYDMDGGYDRWSEEMLQK